MKIKTLLLCTSMLFALYGVSQNTFPATGSVGIGTSTPSARLDVNGNMIVDSSLIVKDSVRFDDKLTVEKDAKFKGETTFKGFTKVDDDLKITGETKMKGDGFVEGNFKFKSLADPNVTDDRFLMINSNGKVKDYKISEISGITYGANCFPFMDVTGALYTAPSWQAVGGPNPTDSKLFTGINCPAYVGIGTEFPYQILDVRGRTYISQGLGVGLNTHNSNYTIHIREQTAGQDIMLIENPTEEIFKIKSDGLIYAREMKLTLDPFPDYVFENDYDLMSIGDLDSYIKTNGHLPHMPSAEIVDKDGIGIGDLVVKQQRTIEELSLYIIQLEKRLQALENKE